MPSDTVAKIGPDQREGAEMSTIIYDMIDGVFVEQADYERPMIQRSEDFALPQLRMQELETSPAASRGTPLPHDLAEISAEVFVSRQD
jgi:hypothetical protein